jgi:MoaA/NifB/PqqE/SkfB family radical SAM enzyme
VAAQRQALEAGAFDLGCQECEYVAESGGRAASLAVHFDRFAGGTPHEYPKLLDLALSSRCNLQCVMCNGGLSSAIRTQREGLPPLPDCYDDRFFEELDEFLPHVERFQFKGGEPFLARENRRIWDRLIELGTEPEVTVTTNGTLLTDDVVRYVRELRMHPNISIDAMDPATLESIRVGVDATRLWRNVDRFQELVEEAGQGMTLSFCLMSNNWTELAPFLIEADRRGLNCNVILVNQPRRYDLLQLPHPELERVHAELAASAPALRTSTPAAEWDAVLERIRGQLEAPVELVVSSVVLTSRPVGDDVQRELRELLVSAYGSEPMVVEAEDGVVCAVEVPEWAHWIGAERFVGRQLDGLGELIEERFGPISANWLVSPLHGVVVLSHEVDAPHGRRDLRVHRLVDEGSGRQRVFVVEAPPGSPSPGPR